MLSGNAWAISQLWQTREEEDEKEQEEDEDG